MQQRKNKEEILQEIIDLSNSDISDFMLNTTKFKDIVKKFDDKLPTSKHARTKTVGIDLNTRFNFDFDKELEKPYDPTDTNFKSSQKKKEKKPKNLRICHTEKLDDVMSKINNNETIKNEKNSVNKKVSFEDKKIPVKKKENSIEDNKKENNNNNYNNFNNIIINNNKKNKNRNRKIFTKSLIHSNRKMLDSIQEENENVYEENEENKTNKINNNDFRYSQKVNINNLSIKKSNSDNNLIEVFKMLDVNDDDENDDLENQNKNKKTYMDKIEERKESICEDFENNKINENDEKIQNNENINNDRTKSIDIPNPTIEYTGTKIDIIEETEYLYFNRNLQNSNDNDISLYKSNINQIYSLKNDIISNNNQNNPIKKCYKIAQNQPSKNISLEETIKNKITLIHFDNNQDIIYCATDIGSLIIYNISQNSIIKQFDNPFNNKNSKKNKNKDQEENTQKIIINCIFSDENYIICGFTKGSIVIYKKDSKHPVKTKSYDILRDLCKNDIIELKFIFKNRKDVIIIYSSDDQENIYKTKINKQLLFKNKIFTKRITGPLKEPSKPKAPYYLIQINPFNNKCIGTVNDRGVYIYTVKKFEKTIIFRWPNIHKNKQYLIFIEKEEDQNKFIISSDKYINVYEINKDFSGVAQQSVFIVENKINKIGCFINDIIYDFDDKNNISFLDYNKSQKENGLYENIQLTNTENNNIAIDNINKNILVINKNEFIKISVLTENDRLNQIYNSIHDINDWEVLFWVCEEIYLKKYPLFDISQIKDYKNIFIDYSQKFLKQLLPIISTDDNNYIMLLDTFISFLAKVELFDLIFQEDNCLCKFFSEAKLDKIYCNLLEPYILKNNFIKLEKIPLSFFDKCFSYYIESKENDSKSWLNELLIHFNIKVFINNDELLYKIKENHLFNVIIFFILSNEDNDEAINYFDYQMPLSLMVNFIEKNINNTSKINNIENNKKIYNVKNRYKDEIILNPDYLKIKILWYINKVIKLKTVINNSLNDEKMNLFIKEVMDIYLNENYINILLLNDNSNLIKEFSILIKKILENEFINKNCELNKEEILNKLYEIFKSKNDYCLPINLLIVNILINDSRIELSNEVKLNLVLFFMENNCKDSKNYPEIKENKFQMNLIEILKLIDSYTFDDSNKLIKKIEVCKESYAELGEYILKNFKN